jgi:hypothetical protein
MNIMFVHLAILLEPTTENVIFFFKVVGIFPCYDNSEI